MSEWLIDDSGIYRCLCNATTQAAAKAEAKRLGYAGTLLTREEYNAVAGDVEALREEKKDAVLAKVSAIPLLSCINPASLTPAGIKRLNAAKRLTELDGFDKAKLEAYDPSTDTEI